MPPRMLEAGCLAVSALGGAVAVVVLFGLSAATLLTLVLVPAMFRLTEDFSAAMRRRFPTNDETPPSV